MVFATVMTQGLAKFTTVLDGRHKVPMTPQLYMRAIVPIGLFFSFSLICGNVAYLYLSVSFIQMLKVSNFPFELERNLTFTGSERCCHPSSNMGICDQPSRYA